ncbi:hypothetical protein [Planktothrix phage Pra-JY27]|nr:hypothetical protein [Planktothrix phage Pag-Yong1]WEV89211.1 hypothetical protein [Synechococcus phage MinM2]
MDTSRIQSTLSRLSDGQLRTALQSGAAPEYLIAAELHRRKQLRDQPAEPAPLREELVEGYADGGFLAPRPVAAGYRHGALPEANFFSVRPMPPFQPARDASPVGMALNAAPNGVVGGNSEGGGARGNAEGPPGARSTGSVAGDLTGFGSAAMNALGGPASTAMTALGALTGGPAGAIMAGAIGSMLAGVRSGPLGQSVSARGVLSPTTQITGALTGSFDNLGGNPHDGYGGFADQPSRDAVASMNEAISAGFGPEGVGWGGDAGSGVSNENTTEGGESKDSTSGTPGGIGGDPGGDNSYAVGGVIGGRGLRWLGGLLGLGGLGASAYHGWPREGDEEAVEPPAPTQPTEAPRTAPRRGSASGPAPEAAVPAQPEPVETRPDAAAPQGRRRGLDPVQIALIRAGIGMMGSDRRNPLAALADQIDPAMGAYLGAERIEADDQRRREEAARRDRQHAEVMRRYDLDRISRERIAQANRIAVDRRSAARGGRGARVTDTQLRAFAEQRGLDFARMTPAQREVLRRRVAEEIATADVE